MHGQINSHWCIQAPDPAIAPVTGSTLNLVRVVRSWSGTHVFKRASLPLSHSSLAIVPECEAGTVRPETFCQAPCLSISSDQLERLIEQGVLRPGDFRCLNASTQAEVAAIIKRCASRALARGDVATK